MRNKFFLVFFVWSSRISIAQIVSPDNIVGDWISPKKDLIVRCYKVNGTYCSQVVWFRRYYDDTPDDPNGVPEGKWMNSIVMNGFTFDKGEWNNGEILNLKNGKRYSAYIAPINHDEINVVGYVLFRIFSESVTFKRYEEKVLPPFN